jgi:hypothetical protein
MHDFGMENLPTPYITLELNESTSNACNKLIFSFSSEVAYSDIGFNGGISLEPNISHAWVPLS